MDIEMKLEAQIKQVIVQALELEIEPEAIADDELLLGDGLGADSIVMLQLVMALETHFAIDVEDEELRAERFVSVRSIAEGDGGGLRGVPKRIGTVRRSQCLGGASPVPRSG